MALAGHLTEGQLSDHKGAALIYPMLPDAETIIVDKGYDSDAFRDALAGRGIMPCIPPRAKRRPPATYRKTLYRQCHKVENMFARLKTGGVSQCATTVAPTHSSALSASRQPLSFGSVNES
jgi:transposase